jgi:hypothetical protein
MVLLRIVANYCIVKSYGKSEYTVTSNSNSWPPFFHHCQLSEQVTLRKFRSHPYELSEAADKQSAFLLLWLNELLNVLNKVRFSGDETPSFIDAVHLYATTIKE